MPRKIIYRSAAGILILITCLIGVFNQGLAQMSTQKPVATPPQLYGHTLVNVNNQIYLFGGTLDPSPLTQPSASSLSNQLWRWVSEPDHWEQVTTTGSPPPARTFHSAASANGKLYIFQGFGISGPLSDSWVYDPTANSWSQLPLVTTEQPVGRYYHSAVTIGDCIYIFGGLDGLSNVLNDLWCYDLTNGEWKQKKSLVLSPHYAHSAVAIGGKMVVWGGHRTATLNELWVYDPGIDDWSQLVIPNPSPPAVEYHTAIASGEKMWVFGGQSEMKASQSVWEFEPLAAGGPTVQKITDLDVPRYWLGAALLPPSNPQKALIFGGRTTGGLTLANTLIYIFQDAPSPTVTPPPPGTKILLLPIIRR